MNVGPDEGYLSVWDVLGFIICFCLKYVTGQKSTIFFYRCSHKGQCFLLLFLLCVLIIGGIFI